MNLAALVVSAGLALAVEASTAHADECSTPITGTYKNQEYGFRFVVPAGLKGQWQSPCTLDDKNQCVCVGNHGLRMDLGNGSVLGVFASYTAELDDPTLGDVLLAELNQMTDKTFAPAAHIIALETVRLDARLGYRVHVISAASDTPDVEDPKLEQIDCVFFADGIRYVLYLRGPSAQFAGHLPRLAELMRTWRWASNYRLERP